MITTQDTREARQAVVKAFIFFARISMRKLSDYQFSFEHGQWWVIQKTTGKTWSAVDTSTGIDFEEV